MRKDKDKILKDGDEIPEDVLDAIPEIVKAMKEIGIKDEFHTGLADNPRPWSKKQ